jgi:hypothetical protein
VLRSLRVVDAAAALLLPKSPSDAALEVHPSPTAKDSAAGSANNDGRRLLN